jgi:hypothetical protein
MIKSVTVYWNDGTRNTFNCSNIILDSDSYFLHNSKREVVVAIPARSAKYITIERN